jgi:hypothetical protein
VANYILTDSSKTVILEFFTAKDDIAATKRVEDDEEGTIKENQLILFRLEKVCDWSE